MTNEYLHLYNKLSERENALNKFDLGLDGDPTYYASSTRYGNSFKVTGSAQTKEKPEWVARAKQSSDRSMAYKAACSEDCKFVAKLKVDVGKENLRVSIIKNTFVLAKVLVHIENEKLKRLKMDNNFFFYNVNQLASIAVCKFTDALPNLSEININMLLNDVNRAFRENNYSGEIILFPYWFANINFNAAPIPCEENNFNEEFFNDFIYRSSDKNNLMVLCRILPELLRIVPLITWQHCENLDLKTEEDLNNKLTRDILKECRKLQLSEKVSEKLNAEPPVTSEYVEALVTQRIRKENQRSNDRIKSLEEKIKMVKYKPPKNNPSTKPSPILKKNKQKSNNLKQKNLKANLKSCGLQRQSSIKKLTFKRAKTNVKTNQKTNNHTTNRTKNNSNNRSNKRTYKKGRNRSVSP